MLTRITNPLPLIPVAISALLTGIGVTGIVLARRTLARGAPTVPSDKLVVGTMVGGGVQPSRVFTPNITPLDAITIRTKPYGYTSFFMSSDERAVISMLQAWRSKHGTGACDLVFKRVANQQIGAYVAASAIAARSVLDTRWPGGNKLVTWSADWFWASGPDVSAAERNGIAPWRAWLWWRVYSIANRYVCDVVPVT